MSVVAETVRSITPLLGLQHAYVPVRGHGRFHLYVARRLRPPRRRREQPAPADNSSSGRRGATLDAPSGAYPLPQGGPPILIVHGMFTTAQSMLLVAGLLASAFPDRTILVPDLLGFDFAHSIPGRLEGEEGEAAEEGTQSLAAPARSGGPDLSAQASGGTRPIRRLPGWT